MEWFKSPETVALTNILVATVAAVIALAAPLIAWRLTRASQLDDQKRQTKLGIFGTLMGNRHTYQSRDAVAALNLIDVAFHDDREVRRLWREYHAMIQNPAFFESSVGHQLHREKLLDLQTAMARVLGYDIDRFDIERMYSPTWLAEEQELAIRERGVRLAAIRNQSPPDPASQRLLTASESAFHAGAYLVRYSGTDGAAQGYGTVFFQDGSVSGSDMMGARYEGQYRIEGDRIRATVALHVPAGRTLVTGQLINQETTLPLNLDLPAAHLGTGEHTIDVAGQPVKISLTRLP
jgi:hypothetical protein